ncbi:putative sigma(54) modulation protein [Escherichia coli]|nr:putative sigma(54) modulation protein [Escherichia coli]
MQLNITGNNVEITEALREFVTAKFAKLEQYLTESTRSMLF